MDMSKKTAKLDPIVASCGICGCPMVSIRSARPKGPRRTVCPTCLQDRMDLIREYAEIDFGLSSKAAKPTSMLDDGIWPDAP